MKISKPLVSLMLIALLCPLTAGRLRGADTVESLEKLSLAIEKSLDSLQTDKGRIQKQAEEVAAQLDLLRSRDVLSPKEHRQMEKWLQTSQRLDGEMDGLRKAETELRKRRDAAVGRLIGAIQSELAAVRDQAEKAEGARKASLLASMRDLLGRRTAWESRLSAGPAPVPLTDPVRLQPWNSREEIRLKGNLLQDEAESARAEIDKLERRIRSLREERDVRRNVAELSRELALFDERDELVGRKMEPGAPADGVKSTDTGYEIDVNVGRNDGADAGRELPSGWVADGAGAENEPADLDGRIDRLEKYRRRLAARADSLEARAHWFLKKAAETAD
jgi:hypothetical protein